MKSRHVIVGIFTLGAIATQADVLRLAGAAIHEAEYSAPSAIIVRTGSAEKRVPFSILPDELKQQYRKEIAEASVRVVASINRSTVTADDLIALSNEVHLDTWEQVTAIGSFQDRPEMREAGGVIVVKAFNAIEANWPSVYLSKDPVGQAGNWNEQLKKARQLLGRANVFIQRRWLEIFIKAGEAVARRDSNEFALMVRELNRNPVAIAALENSRKFFTAKYTFGG